MDRIQPSWPEIKNFKNPLTPGELHLAEFLDEALQENWEIYVQPYLNGDRPDIVILNKDVGMMIFEVKDWQPEYYRAEDIEVLDKSANEKNLMKQYYVSDSKGEHKIPSPLSQVCRYRDNLIGLYLPYLGELIDEHPYNLAGIKVGIYFHNMSTNQARDLVDVDFTHYSIFGSDLLDQAHLDQIAPDSNRNHTQTIIPEWADKIRFWLNPPFHSLEQGLNLTLTPEQSRHAMPSPGQHQRLRGVAGSGKTLVIAQRAASLAEQGKKVLVVTYNITLWHYIKDHVSRAKYGFSWDQIEFRHFHGLCKDYLYENDIRWPISDEGNSDIDLKESAPRAVINSIRSGNNLKGRNYDAILIDEGQDFERLWYFTLCEFLTENDEVLFVVDERQNLYNRNLSWIDSMTGTKFRGRWRELKESFRLPIPLIKKANQFADTFLGGEGTAPIPREYNIPLPGIDPLLVWEDLTPTNDFIEPAWETYNFLTKDKKVHPQDIVILVPTHSDGWELVDFFQKQGIRTNHVFENVEKTHHHKKSFWMGDPRLKMCTIHSFKGWELVSVILITPCDGSFTGGSLDKLIYTSITRSRQNLIILNRNSRYVDYGKSWNTSW